MCAFYGRKNGQSIKARGIEIRRSFMRARQWSTDRLVGCSIVSSLSFSFSLFLSFSRWHAFYGTNTLIAHHRNAMEQRKPTISEMRVHRCKDAMGKVQDSIA